MATDNDKPAAEVLSYLLKLRDRQDLIAKYASGLLEPESEAMRVRREELQRQLREEAREKALGNLPTLLRLGFELCERQGAWANVQRPFLTSTMRLLEQVEDLSISDREAVAHVVNSGRRGRGDA